MTLDEAYTEAVSGAHMTAAHLQPGVCLTYDFKGFRRTWPNGDGCDFRAYEADETADWYEYEAPKPEPAPEPKPWGFTPGAGKPAVKADAWGRPNDPAYVASVDKLIGATATVTVEQSKWGPKITKVEGVKDKWGKPL